MKRSKITRAMDFLDEELIAGALETKESTDSQKTSKKSINIGMLKRWAAIAAVFVFILTGSIFLSRMAGGTHNSIVAFDVNPSLEIEVNESNRVDLVRALNKDAETLIGDMQLEGEDIDTAVGMIVGSMLELGYISAEHNSILLSVNADNDKTASLLKESIYDDISLLFASNNIEASVITQLFSKDKETERQAEANGISAAKATLIQKIVSSGLSNSKGTPYTYAELAKLNVNELKLILESKSVVVDGIESTGHASEAGLIGTAEAIRIAYEDAKIDPDTITRREVEFDFDKEEMALLYEIEFEAGGLEYEYEIHAISGVILEKEFESIDGDDDTITPPEGCITKEQALKIAYEHADIKAEEITDFDCEIEILNGVYVYEIEIETKHRNYDFIIDARTSNIITEE